MQNGQTNEKPTVPSIETKTKHFQMLMFFEVFLGVGWLLPSTCLPRGLTHHAGVSDQVQDPPWLSHEELLGYRIPRFSWSSTRLLDFIEDKLMKSEKSRSCFFLNWWYLRPPIHIPNRCWTSSAGCGVPSFVGRYAFGSGEVVMSYPRCGTGKVSQ